MPVPTPARRVSSLAARGGLLALSLCAPGLAFGQAGVAVVEQVDSRDLKLLKRLDRAVEQGNVGDARLVIDDLLNRSKDSHRNRAVPVEAPEDEPTLRYRGYRALVLDRLLEMPEAIRREVARVQGAAARGLLKQHGEAPPDRALYRAIVERCPLADEARDAALRLSDLALERDDLVAAEAYDRFVERFHPRPEVGWSSRARRALVAARLGEERAARARLKSFEKAIGEAGEAGPRELFERTRAAVNAALAGRRGGKTAAIAEGLKLKNPSPRASRYVTWSGSRQPGPEPRPVVLGDEVFVSNGRRLHVFNSADGRHRPVLPFDMGDGSEGAPPGGASAEAVPYGSLLLVSLLIPKRSPALSRRRVRFGQTFGEHFGSMFIFDRARGHRIVYWEGDTGPGRGLQKPRDTEPEELIGGRRTLDSVLKDGHSLGRAALCGSRVYAALLVAGGEPEAWVIAFERRSRAADDLGIELEPVWATFIGSTPTAAQSPGQPPAFPSVFLCGDQVICHTGTATLAALDALDGGLRWTVNMPQHESGRAAKQLQPPLIEPVRFLERPSLSPLVLVVPPGRKDLYAYDARDGRLAWSTRHHRGSSHRFALHPEGFVIRYGGREVIALDARTGRLASRPVKGSFKDHRHLPTTDAVTGSGELRGGRLLLSVGRGRVREVSFAAGEASGRRVLTPEIGPAVKLPGFGEAGHVRRTPHGLVLVTGDRVLIYGRE